MFNTFNARAAGKKGGQAITSRKQRAARANGKRGGRRPSRTLVERLLGRRIAPEQIKYLNNAWNDLLAVEKQALLEHFQIYDLEIPLDTTVWRSRSRRIPKRIQYLIKKFKLAANYYIENVRPPKSYVVEYRQRSPEEQQVWEWNHPDIPCPPRKVRASVELLPLFGHIRCLRRRNPNWTAKDLCEVGGGSWSLKRAEAALAWMVFKDALDKDQIIQILSEKEASIKSISEASSWPVEDVIAVSEANFTPAEHQANLARTDPESPNSPGQPA